MDCGTVQLGRKQANILALDPLCASMSKSHFPLTTVFNLSHLKSGTCFVTYVVSAIKEQHICDPGTSQGCLFKKLTFKQFHEKNIHFFFLKKRQNKTKLKN